jgi:hypothetical protein
MGNRNLACVYSSFPLGDMCGYPTLNPILRLREMKVCNVAPLRRPGVLFQVLMLALWISVQPCHTDVEILFSICSVSTSNQPPFPCYGGPHVAAVADTDCGLYVGSTLRPSLCDV